MPNRCDLVTPSESGGRPRPGLEGCTKRDEEGGGRRAVNQDGREGEGKESGGLRRLIPVRLGLDDVVKVSPSELWTDAQPRSPALSLLFRFLQPATSLATSAHPSSTPKSAAPPRPPPAVASLNSPNPVFPSLALATMAAQPRSVHDALLFEAAWEVAK